MGKKSRRKPRGRMGLVQLGPKRAFHEFVLPPAKDEIERAMLRGALAAAARQGEDPYQLVGAPRQNPEDHFDFTLDTKRGPEYLDLMEAAPLERTVAPTTECLRSSSLASSLPRCTSS